MTLVPGGMKDMQLASAQLPEQCKPNRYQGLQGDVMTQGNFIISRSHWLVLACLILTLGVSTHTQANTNSRLIGTGGATTTEGTAGGGLVPWALLAGYGDQDEWGGTAWLTSQTTQDFGLNAFGTAFSWDNRFEFSVSKQIFNIDTISSGQTLEQNIFGIKTRLYGDLIYTRAPQISLGMFYKQNDTFDIPAANGAMDDTGVEVYVAASKLWLDGIFHRSVFFNGTLRATRANQTGLMGFGGDLNNKHDVLAELSAGVFINRHWVIGAEYRQKPDNLSFAREDDWQDFFVGWFPNKRVAVVAAWAGLGSIAGLDNQDSFYLSLQLSQ